MHTPRPLTLALFLSLTGIVQIIGCGKAAAPEPKATIGITKGKVTYKGTPVTNGQVEFVNTATKNSYIGKLQAGGTYESKGIPVGDYAVTVGPVPPAPKVGMSKPAEKPVDPTDIPAKYRKANTSGLTTSIKQGDNKFDVEMQD